MKNSKNCIEACLACVIACEACATHGIEMADKSHLQCISLCRDCADICALCARLQARGSSFADALCKLCVEICNACAAECEKHAHHHEALNKAGEACRKCATACAA